MLTRDDDLAEAAYFAREFQMSDDSLPAELVAFMGEEKERG